MKEILNLYTKPKQAIWPTCRWSKRHDCVNFFVF